MTQLGVGTDRIEKALEHVIPNCRPHRIVHQIDRHCEMRQIAFLIEHASIRAILAHLGKTTTPPALAPRACDPPELHAGFACAWVCPASSDTVLS